MLVIGKPSISMGHFPWYMSHFIAVSPSIQNGADPKKKHPI
jgi:hypothetical protein